MLIQSNIGMYIYYTFLPNLHTALCNRSYFLTCYASQYFHHKLHRKDSIFLKQMNLLLSFVLRQFSDGRVTHVRLLAIPVKLPSHTSYPVSLNIQFSMTQTFQGQRENAFVTYGQGFILRIYLPTVSLPTFILLSLYRDFLVGS